MSFSCKHKWSLEACSKNITSVFIKNSLSISGGTCFFVLNLKLIMLYSITSHECPSNGATRCLLKLCYTHFSSEEENTPTSNTRCVRNMLSIPTVNTHTHAWQKVWNRKSQYRCNFSFMHTHTTALQVLLTGNTAQCFGDMHVIVRAIVWKWHHWTSNPVEETVKKKKIIIIKW